MELRLQFKVFVLGCVLLLFFNTRIHAQQIDYAQMFSSLDIVNDTMTANWTDGLFTGNGLLGNMVYMADANTLRIDIGRTDVYDHRKDSGLSHLYAAARLPIGRFLLKPAGKIRHHSARLDLWNAETRGTIQTDSGVLYWRTLTLAEKNCIVLDYKTEGKERVADWEWVPETSISPRYFANPNSRPSIPYSANPVGKNYSAHSIESYWQPMSAGGGYATSWKRLGRTILISVAYSQSENADNVLDENYKSLDLNNTTHAINIHRNWWHHYYQKSFLSIPDIQMQSFYWVQLYKIGSATRQGKPALDLQGPWTRATPWPAYWFNLNMQLEYSPLFTSNHLEIASSLLEMVDHNSANLSWNIPTQYRYNAIGLGRSGGPNMIGTPVRVVPQRDTTDSEAELELGNLTWLLYYYWQYYRYSMNEKVLDKLKPLLEKSTNYFLDVMEKDADGVIHLPYSYSPEYPNGITRDCNYALALFRWACETLSRIEPNNASAPQWKEVLEKLTPYPTDSTGLRIGKDIGFTQSHRHFSHLLMIYPLQLMNWEQPEYKALIARSLSTWHQYPDALQGYSFTGGASIYEMMGDGDKAYRYLHHLLNKYVRPNTMYLESGPVIETPLAATQSLQEMVLQNRNGQIFVFHALPSFWKDAAFKDFRADGAFLVSANKVAGCTKWVSVESLVGGICNIVVDTAMTIARFSSGKVVYLDSTQCRCFTWRLKKGENVVLCNNLDDLNIPINTLIPNNDTRNPWGAKIKK